MANKINYDIDMDAFSDQIKIKINSPELMQKIIEFKQIYAKTEAVKEPKYRKPLNEFWQDFIMLGIDAELLRNKEDSLIQIVSRAIKQGNNSFYKIYEERTDRLFMKVFSELDMINKLINTLVNALSLSNQLTPLLSPEGKIDETFTELPIPFVELGEKIASKYVNMLETLKVKRLQNLKDYKLNLATEQLFNVENEIDLMNGEAMLDYFEFSSLKTEAAKAKAKKILAEIAEEEREISKKI